MINNLNSNKRRLTLKELILLVIMSIIVTFTQLRFGYLGIGEIILLILLIKQVYTIKYNKFEIVISNRIFSFFWITNILFLILGLFINEIKQINVLNLSVVRFDLMSYIFILLLCLTLESILQEIRREDSYKLLKCIFYFGTITMYLLFVYSEVISINFMGKNLYYGNVFFAPLANDPHQFAYFIAPLPFVGVFIITKTKNKILNIVNILLIIFNIQMGIANESTTLYMAWIGGTLLIIILSLVRVINKTFGSKKLVIAIFSIIIAICVIKINSFSEIISKLINSFLVDDETGANRLIIWINSIKAWSFSPIFGLGPGSHSGTTVFAGYESHNTILQILTQSGISGVAIYLIMITKIIKKVVINIPLLAAMISLLIYGFGINDLRRFILWVYFILFYFISINLSREMVE